MLPPVPLNAPKSLANQGTYQPPLLTQQTRLQRALTQPHPLFPSLAPIWPRISFPPSLLLYSPLLYCAVQYLLTGVSKNPLFGNQSLLLPPPHGAPQPPLSSFKVCACLSLTHRLGGLAFHNRQPFFEIRIGQPRPFPTPFVHLGISCYQSLPDVPLLT